MKNLPTQPLYLLLQRTQHNRQRTAVKRDRAFCVVEHRTTSLLFTHASPAIFPPHLGAALSLTRFHRFVYLRHWRLHWWSSYDRVFWQRRVWPWRQQFAGSLYQNELSRWTRPSSDPNVRNYRLHWLSRHDFAVWSECMRNTSSWGKCQREIRLRQSWK